jgi:hypothetical protein
MEQGPFREAKLNDYSASQKMALLLWNPKLSNFTVFTIHIALMMEAASTFETSVNSYQTTRCNNPEDSHLQTRRRENLKSHIRIAIPLL